MTDIRQDTGGADLGMVGVAVRPVKRDIAPRYEDSDNDGVPNDIPDEATHRYAARMKGAWHTRP